MERDGRSLEDGATISGDVVVVGAGPAGLAVAWSLAEQGTKVIVLEGGGLQPDAESSALHEGEIVGGVLPTTAGDRTSLTEITAAGFGGTTQLWAGHIQPLAERDLEPQPFHDVGGWPIGYDELKRWYDPASRFLHFGAGSSVEEARSRSGLPEPPDLGDGFGEALVLTRVYSFADEQRDAIVEHPNIDLVHHANVTQLRTDPSGAVVESAEVRTLDGTTWSATAPKVVLACGGIGNPRLMLASTDHHPAGIGNDHDLVGRYYTDHPKAFGWVLASSLDVTAWEFLNSSAAHDEQVDRGDGVMVTRTDHVYLRLADDALSERGWPWAQAECFFTPGAPTDRRAELAGIDLLGADAASMAVVVLTTEQPLDPDSRVTLGEDTDELGRRRPVVDWRVPDAHADTVADMARLLGVELGARGLGRLWDATDRLRIDLGTFDANRVIETIELDPPPAPDAALQWRTSYHQMCTTRMAEDPGEGVVDADCRVHGMDNLWVAGTSVFATGAGYVPTLTGVALALRLADHLRAAS
ncbi:MAG: GMC family oxidoreductase [Microthrixaceae bacterium]